MLFLNLSFVFVVDGVNVFVVEVIFSDLDLVMLTFGIKGEIIFL